MPDPDQPDTDAGDGDAGQSDEARFSKIEAEQAEQRGILEQIRDRLGAGEGKAHAKAQAHTEDRLEHPPPEAIAEQVRKAVIDVQAEQAQKDAADAHAADHKRLAELAERQPRERSGGLRGRIQAAMFGGPDR